MNIPVPPILSHGHNECPAQGGAGYFFFRQELIDIMDRLKIPQDFLGCIEITFLVFPGFSRFFRFFQVFPRFFQVFPGFSETTSWYAPWVNLFLFTSGKSVKFSGEKLRPFCKGTQLLNIGLPSDCLKIGTISSHRLS